MTSKERAHAALEERPSRSCSPITPATPLARVQRFIELGKLVQP